MKFSMFNVWTVDDGTIILYNSKTGALATFEPCYLQVVNSSLINNDPSLLPDQFITDLIEDGYLLNDGFDEMEYIRQLVVKRQQLVDEYFFSILLSLSCNFGCYYCFENHTDKVLAEPISGRLVYMMSRISKSAKKIAVDWYGGEPLLSFSMLHQLNNKFMAICAANDVRYEISVTTNGYLLSREVIDYLAGTPITHLQITIDGPPETHNISRPLKNGEPTFDTILDNIEQAVAKGLGVFIRTNITKQNIDRIYELYPILEARGLKNKVRILLKPVVSSSVNLCEEQCLTGQTFSDKMVPIYIQAAKNGWIVFPNVDSMQCMGFCVADFPSQFIIDPSGNIYKCGESFSNDESVGFVDEDGKFIISQDKYRPWLEKTPLNYPECRNCDILPICMGGCNMKRWRKGIDCCEELKYNLPDFLRAMVLNQENIVKERR